MKVKELIKALNHFQPNADVVMVIPQGAFPKEDSATYNIHHVCISRFDGSFLKIGLFI